MKQLIINADDFGLSSGVNRSIIEAWDKGILTSASLMIGGSACPEAINMALANPGLQVGLHLTLLQGRAVLAHTGFPTIADQERNFGNDPVHTGMRYFFIRSLRKQLTLEIEEQIANFLKTGLALSHIDGHLNIHMHPVVFDILCKLMPKYGITTFRLSRERLGTDLRISSRRYLGKTADAFIFSRLANRCRPQLDWLGICYADEVKGLLNSGHMTEEYLLKALDVLQDGITEIYFHPACQPDAELARWMPGYQHENELAAITSQRVQKKLEQIGITLRNYRGEEKRDA